MSSYITDAYRRLRDQWDALSPERREALLDDFGPRYVYSSGKIKNKDVTYRDVCEVFASGSVTGYTGPVRTLFDIWDLVVSWRWGLDVVRGGLRLSEELVQEAHELMTMGTYDVRLRMGGEKPGAFKLENYVSGPAEIGVPAVEVPHAVGELADDVNAYLEEGRRSLTIAAFLHARLTDIHPFADGNGRVARLLTNMTLLSMGMPPVVIREQDRASYYAALDVFHLEGDLNPLKRFIMTESILTWEGLLAEESEGD